MKPIAYWFLVLLILGSMAPKTTKDEYYNPSKSGYDSQAEYNQRIEKRLNEIYNMLEYARYNPK